MNTDFFRNVGVVLVKEVIDALRDRRTLLRLMVPAVLMGPLLLLALSGLISSLEERAEKREVMVAGMDHAPTLRNFLERQTYTVKAAPPDYEAQLRKSTLLEPVLVVGAGFEAELLAGVAEHGSQRVGLLVPGDDQPIEERQHRGARAVAELQRDEIVQVEIALHAAAHRALHEGQILRVPGAAGERVQRGEPVTVTGEDVRVAHPAHHRELRLGRRALQILRTEERLVALLRR